MENTKGPTLGNGKICYIEIPASDISLSAAFYKTIFGWKIRTRGDGSIAFDDGIGEVSGTWVLGRKPAIEPGLLISIMVDSVAATLAAIQVNGGKIIKQIITDTPEVIAWFSDPAGNAVGLYQHPGGGNGKVCYLEIPALEISKSAGFYKAIFDWPLRGKGTENVSFDDGVGIVSGMWVLDRKSTKEPGFLVYVMVAAVAATLSAVISHGGKMVQDIGMDLPEIIARFSDPAGNLLGLYQHPAG